MAILLKIIGFANGAPCPIAGQYLKSFDHDAYNGIGFGEFTKDPTKARRFDTMQEALEFRNKTSSVKPLREDGKPNRPLSSAHILLVKLSQENEDAERDVQGRRH